MLRNEQANCIVLLYTICENDSYSKFEEGSREADVSHWLLSAAAVSRRGLRYDVYSYSVPSAAKLTSC